MDQSSVRERLGALLEAAGQMFWEIDLNFNVLYANELLKRIFGEPLGETCHQFMADSENVCPGCPVKQVFEGNERAVSERMRYDKQGRPLWLQHTAIPIRDESGQVVGASEMIVDITERKLMEEWLRDSEHLYRNLVEQVPDIIFSLDAAGRFSFVNTQAEGFLGHPVSAILENTPADYVIPEHRDRLEAIRELRSDAIWDEEVGILDAHGNKKFARIRVKASYGRGESPTGFEGVMRDRTARKKLEVELKASKAALLEKIAVIDELYEHILQQGKSKAIHEHAAEVAHELRQPLAIIGGFARRMAKQLDSPDTLDIGAQRQYSGIISSEIGRLEVILDRLVDFTSREEVRLQNVNPNSLILYLIGVTESRTREKRLHVEVTLGPETDAVPLDPGRFQQLFLNLLCNAIEASPGEGVIAVNTGVSLPSEKALETGNLESEGYYEMKIRNEGPEIPPEELQKVFKPFFTTKEHGTGLGLAVTKKIVEDHSGSISVKSDKDGTVFTVWFPLSDLGHSSRRFPPGERPPEIPDAT